MTIRGRIGSPSKQSHGAWRKWASASESLGAKDPRWRRNIQQFKSDQMIGTGLQLGGDGRPALSVDPKSGLAFTPLGELTINTAEGVVQTKSSPYALSVQLGETLMVRSDGAIESVASSVVGYTPAKPRHWTQGVPAGVASALDQLASRLIDVEVSLSTDFDLRVAKGEVAFTRGLQKFGRNPQIQSGASEDIWDGGGDYPWLASASGLEVFSSSVNDATGNSGAEEITVQGLDTDYEEIEETVSLNGTGVVALSNTYRRVHRAFIGTCGSSETNEGIISVRVTGGGTTELFITATEGQSLMAIYTVPAGHTLYITRLYIGSQGNTNTSATGRLMTRGPADDLLGWRVREVLSAKSTGATQVATEYTSLIELPEKTDIRMRALAGANNTEVAATFQGYLVKG